jgi:hypothetical protein
MVWNTEPGDGQKRMQMYHGNVFRRVLTMTDSEYRRTLLLGAIIGASITLLGFYTLKPSPENHTVTPKTNFEVVDTYKGCDVVRYTDGFMATYKYFLHCENK